MWPQMTFQREMMEQRAGDIKHSLSGHDSGWIGQIWCALEVLQFFYHWLRYNGRVMKMTWPEVTDITKIRDIQLVDTYCPYCTLRVSKSLDLWCVFDRLSNFEKCNLRSGHLMSPGGVIFEVRRSKLSGNVPKCSMNCYAKFGGATRRLFSLSTKNLSKPAPAACAWSHAVPQRPGFCQSPP